MCNNWIKNVLFINSRFSTLLFFNVKAVHYGGFDKYAMKFKYVKKLSVLKDESSEVSLFILKFLLNYHS